MDAERFDDLVRSLSGARSRRRLLASLTALPVAGSLLAFRGEEAPAAGRRTKRRRQRQHTRHDTRQDNRHEETATGTKRRKDASAQGPCGDGSGKDNACKHHGQYCTGYCKKKHGRCRCKKLSEGCIEDRNCCATFGQPMTCQSGACQSVAAPSGCTPTTCVVQGATCGPLPDGCGGTLDCGPCPCTPACLDCQGCNTTTAQCEPQSGICCPGGRCETGVCQSCGVCEECSGGSCGPAAAGTACAGGLCCGTPRSCVDAQTDPSHCGACGASCAPDQTCQGGVCGVSCDSDFCPAATEVCNGSSCRGCTVTCDAPDHVCAGTALQTALTAAGSTGGTVTVCAGRYTGSFTIATAQSVTVIGAGQGEDPRSSTILDALQQGRVLEIFLDEGGGPLMLEQLSITGGAISDDAGAGILFAALREVQTLRMRDCTITANTATDGFGGGIYFPGGTLEMTRCTVSDNHAAGSSLNHGGGIYIGHAQQLTLTDCLIAGNSAFRFGGGIYFEADNGSGLQHTLTGITVVRGNTANSGGGIYNQNTPLVIAADCRVTDNTALVGRGGGIQATSEPVTLLGPDPALIVVDNCHENCVGNVPGCDADAGLCP